MSSTPPDYAALFRAMLGEWRRMSDPAGGEPPRPEEFARAIGGATAATPPAGAPW